MPQFLARDLIFFLCILTIPFVWTQSNRYQEVAHTKQRFSRLQIPPQPPHLVVLSLSGPHSFPSFSLLSVQTLLPIYSMHTSTVPISSLSTIIPSAFLHQTTQQGLYLTE